MIYAFSTKADGTDPQSPLVLDKAANLYGVTADTADDYGPGQVFKVNANGKKKVLHKFTGSPDGYAPSGGLIRDSAGNLYGDTIWGGASNEGAVFKVDAKGNESVLYSFTGGADGAGPLGPLVRDAAGNLYGVTDVGGQDCTVGGCGVVFKLDTTGKETVLHAFTGGSDGYLPDGGLLRDSSGNLYGVTGWGGSTDCSGQGCGIIFKLDANGNETVLYRFTGGSDGWQPYGALVMDRAGNLYGTTFQGGDFSCGLGYGCGVVFKLTP